MSDQGYNQLTDMGLSAAQDAKLDLLLGAWRQKQQLSTAMVEQVRQNVLMHSRVEALPDDWWVQFGGVMNSVLANTNQLQQQIVDTCMVETQKWMGSWAAPTYGQSYLRPSVV